MITLLLCIFDDLFYSFGRGDTVFVLLVHCFWGSLLSMHLTIQAPFELFVGHNQLLLGNQNRYLFHLGERMDASGVLIFRKVIPEQYIKHCPVLLFINGDSGKWKLICIFLSFLKTLFSLFCTDAFIIYNNGQYICTAFGYLFLCIQSFHISIIE